jgi:hypothetical protein
MTSGVRVHAVHDDGRTRILGNLAVSSTLPAATLFWEIACRPSGATRSTTAQPCTLISPARGATARQTRGQHLDLLVRSRVVLVHSAGGRNDQYRSRGLAALHENPRGFGARVFLVDHRPVPASGRAPERRHIGLRAVEATGNYSYACDRSYGKNFLMIGDAFAFIDPVFSSG